MIKLNSKIYVAGHTGLVGSAILSKLKQKIPKISQEVFLIILINGQNLKVHQDLHILHLKKKKKFKQKDQLENFSLRKRLMK